LDSNYSSGLLVNLEEKFTRAHTPTLQLD